MPRPIIEIDRIGKRYRIRGQRERYLSLRDEIGKKVSSVLRPRSSVSGQKEDFWALRDVSFCVNEGEAVGIIGRNGAGKSTLLKILSRITPPTEGRIIMRGRVASLLEVGTGFHPELTGRENVYLNGSILGMSRAEVKRRFDEIVAFAEVEKFLDTPVKRYSSGMYVRLAFAVAAHLEPEILIVDEVLAVGDAAFQKKCLGKMGDVSRKGRTVLFVSHNMAAIAQLCQRCLLIAEGRVELDAASERSIASYLTDSRETRPAPSGEGIEERGTAGLRITSVICEPVPLFIGSPCSISIHYSADSVQTGLRFGVSIENAMGQRITSSYMGREGLATGAVQGEQCARISFPVMSLLPRQYFVTVGVHKRDGELIVRAERAASFRVIARDLTESGHLVNENDGLVWLDHLWHLSGGPGE